MTQGVDGHSSDVIYAIDDIGAPDVIPEGEDFPPHVTESVVAGLEVGRRGVCIEFRTDGLAIPQLDHGDRARQQ